MALQVFWSNDCRVVVDKKARTAFERCHRPRSWWAIRRVSPEFTCSLDDVIGVHYFRNFRSLEFSGVAIVTKRARALLNTDMEGFEGVIRFLAEECKDRGPGPWYENPNWAPMVIILLFVLGLIGLPKIADAGFMARLDRGNGAWAQ